MLRTYTCVCLVWQSLSKGNQGLRVGEESLTDIVLLIAENFSSGSIKCKKFTRREENKIGADWLWFFVQSGRWYSALIQAKKLYTDSNSYAALKAPSPGPTQMNRLIGYGKNQQHVPLYCFYNSWSSVPQWANRYQGQSEDWGCAVAAAERVRAQMKDNKLKTIGPLSQPWSVLVCPRQKERGHLPLPDRVRSSLENLLGERELPPVKEDENEWIRWATEPVARRAPVDEVPGNLAGVVVVVERV